MTNIETIKELVSEHRFRIKLYDHVLDQVSTAASAMSEAVFPTAGRWAPNEFTDRLRRYEDAVRDLLQSEALIAFWGEPYHVQVLTLPPKRLTADFTTQSGLSAWLALRWYPIAVLLYAAGIAAVAARRYGTLKEMLASPVDDRERRESQPLVLAVTEPMMSLHDAFKGMAGYERYFTPRSEYLYVTLAPMLEPAVSLGSDYETCFDEFEIMYALEHAYERSSRDAGTWGPPGRFGWKFERGQFGSPYHRLVSQAKEAGSSWAPLEAGLFGGSIDNFTNIASSYGEYLSKLHWR